MRLFKIVLLSAFLFSTISAAGMYKSNVDKVWIKGGGTVKKSSKWPASDFWYKALGVLVDDTSKVSSESCGVNIQLWGFTSSSSSSGSIKDSSRIYFDAVSRLFKTAWDTTRNGQNAMSTQLIDSSIVITDSLSSTKLDNVMDMIQISPICCYDSIQAWIYPNAWTKKASWVKVLIRMLQIDPKSWR